MKVRVTSVFALRWQEEWDLARRQTENSQGAYQRRVELFLEQFGPEIARTLKHQLLDVLLADSAALVPQAQSSASTANTLDTNLLDC